MRILRPLAALALLLPAACIPYATGTTALPAPQGQVTPNGIIYFIPGGVERLTGDAEGGSYMGMDMEVRYGLDGRSDVGVRIPGLIGVVGTYKRRVDGRLDEAGPALAYLVGAGVVNAGDHAHLEASLLASGRPGRLTPYGGVKAMHVLPLAPEAVRDDPTVGVFAGLRIGTETLGISPEIAVFYDRSALELRDRTIIVVPSFTFHGDRLLSALLGSSGPGRPPTGPWP